MTTRSSEYKFFPVRVLGDDFDKKFKDLHSIISEDFRMTTTMLQAEISQSVSNITTPADSALYARVKALEDSTVGSPYLSAQIALINSALGGKADVNHTHPTPDNGYPNVVTITSSDSPYSAKAGSVILVNALGGAITINLPATASVLKWPVRVKLIDATNSVTIDGDGGETIDGATTKVLSVLWDSVVIFTDESNWFIL